MNAEQKAKAIEVIEAAETLGAGKYFEYEESLACSNAVAPLCAVGHLAWYGGARNPVQVVNVLSREFGIGYEEENELVRVNDSTSDENRKEAVLEFLASLPIKGVR
jgi:hypothetical protein